MRPSFRERVKKKEKVEKLIWKIWEIQRNYTWRKLWASSGTSLIDQSSSVVMICSHTIINDIFVHIVAPEYMEDVTWVVDRNIMNKVEMK